MLKPICLIILIFVASTAGAANVIFVGSAKPAQRVSMNDIDHSAWQALVAKYVSADGNVNYAAWKTSSADVTVLRQYLGQLSTADPAIAAARGATLAFWINAYNALTIDGILREYPTTTIRNHTAKLFGYNIWDDLRLFVGGTAYSLNQIEHDVLRKLGEPRIHFAIVCASKGCPRLLNQAYTPDQIESQLETNAKDFFSRPENFAVEDDVIKASSILDWFGDDFGKSDGEVIDRVTPWLPAKDRDAIKGKSPRLRYQEYDWSLND